MPDRQAWPRPHSGSLIDTSFMGFPHHFAEFSARFGTPGGRALAATARRTATAKATCPEPLTQRER